MMFKVLVIGAGTMGSVHAEAYAAMDGVQLAGIVDIQTEKGGQLANKLNTRSYASFEEAMAAEQADVVDVCLPTFLHKDYVLKAAEAGKHVICEKPIALNLADAEEMIRTCKEKRVKLFVGHVLRFFPEYGRAKAIVDQGVIGKPAVMRTTRGGAFPQAWNDWYADMEKSGGLTLDMIIHDFDFLRWCFGEVERVYAKGMYGRGYSRLDYSLVTLRFESGVIAHVEGTWAHNSFSMKFEIAGTSGILDYDSSKDKPIVASFRAGAGGAGGVAVPESPLLENPYHLELKHFMTCIAENRTPLVSERDAVEALKIALAAIESMETGLPVYLKGGKVPW